MNLVKQFPFVLWGMLYISRLDAPIHIGLDIGQSMLPRLLTSISRHENCPPPLAKTCLMFAGQPGALRASTGYAIFENADDRRRAAIADIQAKLQRGWTVRKIVGAYNIAYMPQLLEETGLSPEDRLP